MDQVSNMSQIVNALSQDPSLMLGFLLGSLGIIAVTTIAVSAILGSKWKKVRQYEEINALKLQMLERGMSAEEIKEVVSASPRYSWPEKLAEHAMKRHRCGPREFVRH